MYLIENLTQNIIELDGTIISCEGFTKFENIIDFKKFIFLSNKRMIVAHNVNSVAPTISRKKSHKKSSNNTINNINEDSEVITNA